MRAFKAIVLDIYKKNHSGKENAITRSSFIFRYLDDIMGISDRQFRQVYSQLPICTCDKGGFYPIRKDEILEYRDYLRKKAIPLFSRFKRVCDAHPDLADDEGQLEFSELEWTDDEGKTDHDE